MKKPGLFGVYGDYTTQLYRECTRSHYKDPYNQFFMESKVGIDSFRSSIDRTP